MLRRLYRATAVAAACMAVACSASVKERLDQSPSKLSGGRLQTILTPRPRVRSQTTHPLHEYPRTLVEESPPLTFTPGKRDSITNFGPIRVDLDTAVASDGLTTASLLSIFLHDKIISTTALNERVDAVGFVPATPRYSALVYVSLYSGGAHCCGSVQAVEVQPTVNGYHREATQDLGNRSRANWKRLRAGGPYVLVGIDNDLAYKFTGFGGSVFPIMIWQFANEHFSNVTKDYPAAVLQDAATHHAEWLQDPSTTAALAEVADLLTVQHVSEARKAFRAVEAAPLAPQMRQWLIARGYGDPLQTSAPIKAAAAR